MDLNQCWVDSLKVLLSVRESQQAKGFWRLSVLQKKSIIANTLMLLLTAGAGVWFVTDYFFQRNLLDTATREYSQDARRQALAKQQQLNGYLSAFSDRVRLNANYRPLLDQFGAWKAASSLNKTPYTFTQYAPWMEQTGSIVGHISVDYALVLDTTNRLVAVYDKQGDGLPAEFKHLDSGLFKSGGEKVAIKQAGDSEFVVAGSDIIRANQKIGRLVYVAQFDNALLDRLIGNRSSYIAQAVVDVDNRKVIAGNSAAVEFTTASNTSRFKLIYQAPVLSVYNSRNLAFMLWINSAELSILTYPMLAFERKQRLLTLLLFSLLVSAIVWRLSRRLTQVQQYIYGYGDRLGIPETFASQGDEIETIKNHITCFADEMVAETSALEYQAMHDALTSLPNRMHMLERLNTEIGNCEKNNAYMALLIIDLDRFKEVNDTLGHHMGDRLLQEAGRRLVTLLRPTDLVAKLGGDEFAIILSGAHRAQVIAVCKKIFRVMERPVVIDGVSLRIGMSIGAALCPEHGLNTSLLMQRADVAMYDAKRHQSGFSIYNRKKDNNNTNRLGLSNALHEAIDHDQLLLEYQPLVDIKSNEVACVEALVRWQHPSLGLVRPDEFISLAEQNGVIRPLTLWVIDHALAQTVRWKKAGLQLKLSINLSVRCLQDRSLPSQVEKLVGKHQVAPDSIILEVTESAVMSDPVTARRVMRRLSNMGFLLSIDDFGTGYSSLSYLQQLPVDEVKIDKSFVIEMDSNKNDAAIVQATIDLAHNLGMKVVAEGVENHQVWDRIQALGCDTAQGYFISKPATASELVRWIRARDVQDNTQEQVLEACSRS